MIFRGAPDPAGIPQDAARFFGSGPEVHFLDEGPVGMRDDQANVWITPDQRPHRPGRQFCGTIVRMPLTSVFQAHCQQQRHACTTTCLSKCSHGRPFGVDTIVSGIRPDGWHVFLPGFFEYLLPPGHTRMHSRDSFESIVSGNSFVQPGISLRGITPENAG